MIPSWSKLKEFGESVLLCDHDIQHLVDTGGDLAEALRDSNGVHLLRGSAHLVRRTIEALAFTKDSKTLRVIDLPFGNMGDEGARTLAQSVPAGLEELRLWRNSIGTEGAKALAAGLPKGLKTLDLGYNRIGGKGAEALAAKLPRGLQYLNLQNNGICNKGVQALAAGLPGDLKTLILEENSFGIEGAAALAASLPAGLENLQPSRLSHKEEEIFLLWLGKKEPRPVADVLLRFFFTPSRQARAKALLEGNQRRLATLQGLHTGQGIFVTARNVSVLFCGSVA